MTAHTAITAQDAVAAEVDLIHAIASGKVAYWDRGDGYHANDPAAPALFRCDGCDAPRETEARCFCPDCNEVTGCYSDRFDAFNDWMAHGQADRRLSNSHIDAGMAALNAKQAARWDREGEL